MAVPTEIAFRTSSDRGGPESVGGGVRAGRDREDGSRSGRTPVHSVATAMLRAPLFVKILAANAVLIGAVAVAVVDVMRRYYAGGSTFGVGAIIGMGVLLSVLANGVILRLALMPLRNLENTAMRVRSGDMTARAEISPLADNKLRRVARTFNDMLDSSMAYRRRLRDVSARATHATEEERKRVARELHDGTAQTLAALRVQLRLARSGQDVDAMRVALDRVSAELGEAIEEVRRMAHGLRPPALDMLGLATAVRSYVESSAQSAGLDLRIDADDVAGALSPEGELALYRILQEAVSNVVRHSGASRLEVELGRRPGGVELRVRDDGLGFVPPETLDSDRGLGLFGMQERAGYVGGEVVIESTPGLGTTVTTWIPSDETSHA